MKIATKQMITILLFLSLLLPLEAQTPDLRIEKEITPEYIVYLTGKEAEYLNQVTSPLAGDDTPTMKAHWVWESYRLHGLILMAIHW